MSDVTDIKAEVLLLRRENKELRDENKQLKLRDITLSLMVKLMHFAISYMQERTDKVVVYDGIRLSDGYFERRMAALGIVGIEVDG